jgi:hypothetical protein
MMLALIFDLTIVGCLLLALRVIYGKSAIEGAADVSRRSLDGY